MSPCRSRSRRRWSAAACPSRRVGSLLRAEGIAISRTRLHQLSSGTGAPPTAEQLERLASVLGVSPGYFAEYRLWRARALLDPGVVGFDRAMANFDRLRGRRDLPFGRDRGAGRGLALSWPGQQPVEGACMSESEPGGRGDGRGAGHRGAAEPEVSEEAAQLEAPEDERPPDPAADVDVANDPAIAAAEEELLEEAIPVPVGPAAGRQAKVYLCERGHRTVAVWSEPDHLPRAPDPRATECGRQLYPIGELPEQVQKALNPLKASKKASKG